MPLWGTLSSTVPPRGLYHIRSIQPTDMVCRSLLSHPTYRSPLFRLACRSLPFRLALPEHKVGTLTFIHRCRCLTTTPCWGIIILRVSEIRPLLLCNKCNLVFDYLITFSAFLRGACPGARPARPRAPSFSASAPSSPFSPPGGSAPLRSFP